MVWVILKEYSLLLEEICLLFALFHVGIKKEKKNQVLFLSILTLIAIIRIIVIPDRTIRFITFEILDFIAFCTIAKLPFLKKITFYYLSYFLCGMVEVFIMWLIKNETPEWRTEIGRADFFQLRLVLSILLFVIGKMRWKKVEERAYPLKSYWYISLVVCLLGIILAGFLFLEMPDIIKDKQSIFQFSIMLLGIILLANTIGIISLAERRRLDKEIISLQSELLYMQEKYYAELSQKHTAFKKMKHDMKAQLIMLDELNRKNGSYEVQNYLDNLLLTHNKISHSDYDTGNKTATIVVNYFADLSKENGIQFSCKGHFEENLKMTEIEINSLLYNTLNNAFEECMCLPNHEVKWIALNIKNLNRTLLITASNFCRSDILRKSDTDLITSKKDKENHGYGIKIMKSIVANYDGEIKFKCESRAWIVEMIFFGAYV